MKVTNQTITLIKNRFRDQSKPKINQSQLAEHMQLGKAWVSKLMNKKLQNLSEKQVEQLEEFLGIPLQAFVDKENQLSPIAKEISRKMSESEAMSKIVEALLEMDTTPLASTI
jgi:transcriptional regulator with XRE-family HTH domain